MRKYLLPETGKFYKANLHCHSTVSDGKLTPEEIKKLYMSMGYSIVAYTDHSLLEDHQDLTDEKFLALNGYEDAIVRDGDAMGVDIGEKNDYYHRKTFHCNFIALEPDNLERVPYSREKVYSAEFVSELFLKGRECGFFGTYNHPTWSGENYEQYMNYHNMHAMEIANYISQTDGYEDYNPRVYADMLRGGERIYCIGADDNHNHKGTDPIEGDSGGAWTMIKADSLDYRTITKALLDGNFYASQGPEIHEMYIEDDTLFVTTSDAASISFAFEDRRCHIERAKKGETVNHASVKLDPIYGYVRVTVTDHNGNHANSNAYFLDEILK